jgi:hypothetical protein
MTKFDISSVKTEVASSPFEWNALAAKPGVELWAIRVPRNFKPSRLADFQPSKDGESSKRGIFGTVQTSKSTYQLRLASTQTSVPADAAAIPNTEQDPAARPTLADSLLLPSSTSAKVDAGIGKGPREQGDTNTGHEAAVKEELGVGKVVAVGGEEMEGLQLVVPDVRRNAMFMGEWFVFRYHNPMLTSVLQHLKRSPDISSWLRWPRRIRPLPTVILHSQHSNQHRPHQQFAQSDRNHWRSSSTATCLSAPPTRAR